MAMDERWGTIAEACTETEPDGDKPQTAKEALSLWKNTMRSDPTEAIRVRHCCGCQWLKSCGQFLYCSYLLDTGTKRPGPAGHGCTVKQTPAGWEYPSGYAEWCRAMDREYGKRNKKPKKSEDFALIYARQLYDAKYHSADIAEIVGIPVLKLRNYATAGKWKKGDKSRVHTRIGDLSGEKELYRRARAEWERLHKGRNNNDDEVTEKTE